MRSTQADRDFVFKALGSMFGIVSADANCGCAVSFSRYAQEYCVFQCKFHSPSDDRRSQEFRIGRAPFNSSTISRLRVEMLKQADDRPVVEFVSDLMGGE